MADFVNPVILDQILSYLILAVIGAFGTGFFAFLRRLNKCTEKNARDLCTLKRAFAAYVQIDLIQTKNLHPKERTSEVKDLVDTLLKDDDEVKIA